MTISTGNLPLMSVPLSLSRSYSEWNISDWSTLCCSRHPKPPTRGHFLPFTVSLWHNCGIQAGKWSTLGPSSHLCYFPPEPDCDCGWRNCRRGRGGREEEEGREGEEGEEGRGGETETGGWGGGVAAREEGLLQERLPPQPAAPARLGQNLRINSTWRTEKVFPEIFPTCGLQISGHLQSRQGNVYFSISNSIKFCLASKHFTFIFTRTQEGQIYYFLSFLENLKCIFLFTLYIMMFDIEMQITLEEWHW